MTPLDSEGSLKAPAKDWQILWTLAWPAVLLNSLQTINSLLDGFFIEKLHPAALVAVGASTTVIFFFGNLTMMLGTATTALVSRFYGAEEHENVREASQRSISLSLYLGVIFLLAALPAAPMAARAFIPSGNTEAMKEMAVYLSIFALSLPALNLIQCLAGSLRGIGDTVSPMVLSGIQIVLHVTLNWMLIFPGHQVGPFYLNGANMGLAGAASALAISAWISAIAYVFWAKQTPLQSTLSIRWPGLEWATRILRIAIPSGLLGILRVTSLMAFTFILSRVPDGSAAVASMRLGFSIEAMAFMPCFGLAIAASALVGQSLGMRDPDRATRLGWLAGHHAGAVSTVMAGLLLLFAGPLSHLLASTQPSVAAHTQSYVMHVATTETFFGYAMVMIGAMQGAGDTQRPMWMTFITMWLVRVPLAAFLAMPFGLGMGVDGCWLSLAITQAIAGILSMFIFHAGKWREVQV